MANPKLIDGRIKIVRASLVLTTAYVAGTVIDDCGDCNQLMIYFNLTKGSITSLEIKVEFSFDGVTFHQEVSESISSGVATMNAEYHKYTPGDSLNGVLSIPIKCDKIKIWAKCTGTVTNSLLKIDAIVGVS